MNKQELIEEIEDLKELEKLFGNNPNYIEIDTVIRLISKLDEPQPLKLKDVIKRIEGLNLGSQKVWLDEILHELGSDYGTLKYKDGYGQGKLEGEWVGQQLKDADKIRQELNKPVIPQFVADWIEACKENNIISLSGAFEYAKGEVEIWLSSWENQEFFALAWINGYEVEKEKRYYIRLKNVDENYNYLTCIKHLNAWALTEIKRDKKFRTEHTKKQLEEGGFGEVFDSPLFEVEEVEA